MPRGVYPRKGFWEQVDKSGDCWEWKGQHNKQGYGQFHRTGTHRYSWEQAYGPIPDGLWVLHRCDNPPCVRPDHLWLGTVLDNNRDMAAKGRRFRPTTLNWPGKDKGEPAPISVWVAQNPEKLTMGEAHPNAKLTDDAVREIRANPQISNVAYAVKFGLTRAGIRQVRIGHTWKHVTQGDDEPPLSGVNEPAFIPEATLPTHVDHDGALVSAASVRVQALGGTLTEAEAIAVLKVAGWPDALIPQALAVAWCESKWSPYALGDGGRSAGWFQLNIATWFRYAGEDAERWADPLVNARVAWATYQYDIGRGYRPWTQWSCRTAVY